MKNFIQKNYVFLIGLMGAVSLFLEQAVTNQQKDIKVIMLGVLMAAIGYIANAWKGGGITVTGIIGSLSIVFLQLHESGNIDWTMFGLLAVTKVMAALTASLQAYKPKD